MSENKLVIGIDFGTDSARAIVVNPSNGNILADSMMYYPMWMEGRHCDPALNMYRQHPQDYIDVICNIIPGALKKLPAGYGERVTGISMDTTGSTPVLLNRDGKPLALCDGFVENPNAMFVLWKDHTAIAEAEEINALAKQWHTDYTRYEGGIYSAEWAWAKVLHILRKDDMVAPAAYSWAEHCDWMPALLTGGKIPEKMMRSRCAAGHKAMWHKEWSGLPDEDFLHELDPRLKKYRSHLFTETVTADTAVGTLSREWADRLGLHERVVVGSGALDCHFGAVGAEIKQNSLVRVIGTSTCDIMIANADELTEVIPGICGQVEGSVVPGYIGLEAGQSAFGDLFAWYKDILSWPLKFLENDQQASKLEGQILKQLGMEVAKIPVGESSVLALDWINGRRTPDADQTLKAAIAGIGMGTSASHIYKALVEATAFGSRAIMERFTDNGISIDSVIGIGGIANKSPVVMQTLSDVMNVPIRISSTEQTCAFGAAMFASVVAGIYPDVQEAQKAMGQGFRHTYSPIKENADIYSNLYNSYLEMGKKHNG